MLESPIAQIVIEPTVYDAVRIISDMIWQLLATPHTSYFNAKISLITTHEIMYLIHIMLT